MSYTTNITEELTIRNTDVKTAHIVSQIFHYLQQLDSMYSIRRFHIIHAELIADEDRVEVRNLWKDADDGLYHVEYDAAGHEMRVSWREDMIPSDYHGLLNMAAGLRRSIPPIIHPAKEITFRIDYFCECSLAQIGFEFWSHVFEALDDEILRRNVRYTCVQDNDSCAETAFTCRYDDTGFHEVAYRPGLKAIAGTGKWEFDLYMYIPTEDREEGTPEQQEIDEEVVAAISTYTEIYGLSFDADNMDEINTEQIMNFLSERGYDPTLSMLHTVSRDFGKLAAIRYDYDADSGRLLVESVRL